MKTMKVKGGSTWHVVHETRTGHRRTTGFVICRPDEFEGEHRGGVPTCVKCKDFDNPFNLKPTERLALRYAAENGPLTQAIAGLGKLMSLDYIDDSGRLTRRGQLVADDFTIGAAPFTDEAGVTHARTPLSYTMACSGFTEMPGYDKMTTERYGQLRKLARPTSCLLCIRGAR